MHFSVCVCLKFSSKSKSLYPCLETSSMVDPQWNMLYWRSRCDLHTVCWDAVGWEWGTTSVYFGIIYVCYIASILPVFAVGPHYQHWLFSFMSKISFKGQKHNLRKIPYMFKTWMGYVIQILIKLETSFIHGFLQLAIDVISGATCAVTNEACNTFSGVCVLCRWGSSLELSALCRNCIERNRT